MSSTKDKQARLLKLLHTYQPDSEEQEQILQRMIDFAGRESSCLERSCVEGHFTASALVLSPDNSEVALIRHLKLGKWLQPGGHADGDPDLKSVAKREVWEETGLAEVRDQNPHILDLDIHQIPQYGDTAAHLHYDVRYCFISETVELRSNGESLEIRWVPRSDIPQYTKEASILRLIKKTQSKRPGTRSYPAADTNA